ncbi:MAG: hypothetical protein LUI87_07540 [Lachnospiraceae bacterium]|nr:hypothetical protein [Lachnospiraceae bacterium]
MIKQTGEDIEDILGIQIKEALYDPASLPGFVIELGQDNYFRYIRKRTIFCGNLHQAKRFINLRAAKQYALSELCYYGLQVHICRIVWHLVAYDARDDKRYYDGSGFTTDVDAALWFSSIDEAEGYLREKLLTEACFPNEGAIRMETVGVAAA